jgi:hypothetical protein
MQERYDAQRHMIRRAGLVLAVALAAWAFPAAACAALFFLFNPTSAKPGDRVTLRTPGTPLAFDVRRRGVRPLQPPIRLYLVSNETADAVTAPADPRLHAIGSIVLDKRGRGVLRFTVPELPTDSYAVAAVCRQCAPYSNGRTFFVLGVNDRDIAARWRPLMLLRVEAR